MKKIATCIILSVAIGFVVVPIFTIRAEPVPTGLIPACNTEICGTRNSDGNVVQCSGSLQKGQFKDPCGWTHLLQLGGNILKFLIYLSVPVAAIAFTYAGWLYLSARGNPSQISKAHGIFLNVGIGFIIVLVAWLVVDLILQGLASSAIYSFVQDSVLNVQQN